MPRYYGYGSQDRISELLRERGRIAAEGAYRSGDIWGTTLANLGQHIGGQFQQHAERQKQESERMDKEWAGMQERAVQHATQTKRSQAIDQLFSGEAMPTPKDLIRVLGPVEGLAVAKGLDAISPNSTTQYKDRMERLRDAARGIKALPPDKQPAAYGLARQGLIAGGVVKPEEAPEEFNPDVVTQLAAYGQEPAKPSAKHMVTVPGPNGQPMQRLATEEELASGVQAYRAPTQESKERLWVIRDGKPLRVSESEYRPGDLPANTREQGRPVTSGDANRVADLDTSLDDLNALGGKIEGKGSTGVVAKIGAKVPNVITEWTGFGEDAKKKQAMIDRVKQVIGKALEGGVLRKEDETKYEKILPTIGDVPEVVQSKIDGLWKAIGQRRQTLIDSLADAGYDTTKYSARAPRERVDPQKKADPLGIR